MPASVVKDPEDERLWRKAKAIAEKQGRSKDYAYIMGIFQKMTGSKGLSKSFTVPAAWRGARIPGQVPGQGGRNLERLLDMPEQKGGLAILDHTEPRLTPDSVVKGLGLDLAEESDWRGWLTKASASAQNEVVMRKALYERFLESRTPPELRRALFQRAMVYYGGMRKSFVQIVTPRELLVKARSSTPVGGVTPGGYKKVKEGQYRKVGLKEAIEHHGGTHAPKSIAGSLDFGHNLEFVHSLLNSGKVPDEGTIRSLVISAHRATPAQRVSGKAALTGMRSKLSGSSQQLVDKGLRILSKAEAPQPGTLTKAEARGGNYHRRVKTESGYRYYYAPDKYAEREDAHLDGDTALRKRLTKMCVRHVTKAGEKGCDHSGFKLYGDRFGADKVAAALREATGPGGPLQFEKGIFKLRSSDTDKRGDDE